MKIVKLLGIAALLVGVIVLVVWLSNGLGHKTDPKHDNNFKLLTEDIDAAWSQQEGWNATLFSDNLDNIAAKENNGYITAEEKDLAEDHLYNVALKKTNDALNSLYSDSNCQKGAVDKEYAGIKRIAANSKYAGDAEVRRQQGIYSEYTAALNFISSGVAAKPGFHFPSTWNSFDAGASAYRSKAAAIKGNTYWSEISGITKISQGLSQSTIDNKISDARGAFARSLCSQIKSAYSNPKEEYVQSLRDVEEKFYREFPSQRGSLSGFVDSYISQLYE